MIRPNQRLLLDMDGPLAAFDLHFWNRCTDQGWGFNVAGPHEQTARFFTDHMPDKAQRALARKMVESPGWFRELPVTEGAQQGVQDLLSQGVQIWVCTKPLAASHTCASEKMAWIEEHFPDLQGRVIVTPDKSLVQGDVLLDDAPKLSWIPRATWEPRIFTAPYNGAGSKWEGIPSWSWGDPLEGLL